MLVRVWGQQHCLQPAQPWLCRAIWTVGQGSGGTITAPQIWSPVWRHHRVDNGQGGEAGGTALGFGFKLSPPILARVTQGASLQLHRPCSPVWKLRDEQILRWGLWEETLAGVTRGCLHPPPAKWQGQC